MKAISLFIFAVLFTLFLPNLNADWELPLIDDEEQTISMDFQDASLKDILKVFSMQSGLNFIASEAVENRKITLYLDRVSVKEAMKKIFKANNLSYDLDRTSNIFIVKDWGKSEIETITEVFHLKYATVSSSSLKEEMYYKLSPATASAGTGGIGGGTGAGGGAGTGGSGKWKAEEDTGITVAVKKSLSKYGSLIEDYRTNSLIVTDTPNRMLVIAQVIASLDVPVSQILLEVEMLDVSKNTVDKLGVNWPQMLAALTVPGQRITKFPFGDKGTSGIGWTIDPEKGLFDQAISNIDLDFGAWAASNFGPSVLTVLGATLTLDFLRTQADTKILARPRIMTLNNETAEIKITTNEAIGSITTTQGQGTASTTTVSAERIETGVSLRVTPQINLETGQITMFIHPIVKDATTSTFNTSFKDPEERSTKSVVQLKDGETVVIGGLIRNEKSETTTKLPILGDIPLIGALFRHKNKDKDKERELIVFITPHIIKDTNITLSQIQKFSLPEREQSTLLGIDRQIIISNSLNNFEKKGK